MNKKIKEFKFDEDAINETIKICKALSEPVRLKILGELGIHQKGNCESVGDLAKILGKDQSVIFRHLKILEEVGLINTSKQGNTLFSCTTPRAKKIITFFRNKKFDE